MNKLVTLIGLSFAIFFSYWVSYNTYKINDDWLFRCHSGLYTDGFGNIDDAVRSIF